MLEIVTILIGVLGFILAVLWIFLPWIIIAKLDQIIDELRRISTGSNRR